VWSLGVLIYFVVTREIKNVYARETETTQETADGVFNFEEEEWKRTSETLRNFVKRCLRVYPVERPAVKELKNA